MKHHHSGQGLIEALIILVFVGAGLAAILTFQNYLFYSTNLSRQQSDANLLAINQIETLKNYTSLSAYQTIASSSGTSTVGNTTYTVTTTITTTASPTYKTASITVSWADSYGIAKSIILITNIAGLDPGAPATFM